MIKFEAEINVNGFQYYNYVAGRMFDEMGKSPNLLGLDITRAQFESAMACKEKIKKAAIKGIQNSRKK